MCCRFPGTKPADDIIGALQILLSKNVNGTIDAKTRDFGGFKKCDKNLLSERFDKGIIQCDEGFVYDRIRSCFIAPNVVGNFSQMYDLCKSIRVAHGIKFYPGYDSTDEDVQNFIDLLKSGKANEVIRNGYNFLHFSNPYPTPAPPPHVTFYLKNKTGLRPVS